MNEIAEIRAQTIVYKNDLVAVERSVASIANAVSYSRKNDGYVKFAEVSFGDASPNPIMDDKYISDLNAKYGEFIKVDYTFFNLNSGTSKGQNILVKNCRSKYLMLYNPDIVVAPDYFVEMMKVYEEKGDEVGMVEPRQTPLEHPKSYNTVTGEEIWGAMACVIVPSDTYIKLGGLDEKNFFMYCDDVDFSWRLRLNGKKVIYCPGAVVFHGHRLNKDGLPIPTEAELYYSAEAALMLAYKWSNKRHLGNLLRYFETSGSKYQKKALAYFKEREKNGDLPEQLDKDHKIAYFKNGCYTKHKYSM